MAELRFYLDDVEMQGFTSRLVREGYVFVPDIHYDRPVPKTMTTVASIIELATTWPAWFLKHDAYASYPLILRRLPHVAERPYYIMQRYGGPLIHLSWSGKREHKGVSFLRPGRLFMYPSFYPGAGTSLMTAPAAQRAAYEGICRIVKSGAVVTERGSGWPRAWVGPGAVRAWQKGLPLGSDPNTEKPGLSTDKRRL